LIADWKARRFYAVGSNNWGQTMNGHPFAFAAVAAMLIASPLAAEPVSTPKPAPARPASERPAPTLLASADVRLGETVKVDPAAAPKPHRNARVTTCRCADVATPQN
jgi:hypothetical protein